VKALVMMSDCSAGWDDAQVVESVYLVPDDFDHQTEYKAFVAKVIEVRDPRVRWTKDGSVHGRTKHTPYALWRASLIERFGATKMEIVEV
jgi:hypothetical protein